MSEVINKPLEKRKLKRKAELLWRLVVTTPGVADLTEPMKRAEHYFERLTGRQRVTVGVIAAQLVKGFHDIDKEEETREREATASPTAPTPPTVQPDEIIPPGQDDVGDGSGTGD